MLTQGSELGALGQRVADQVRGRMRQEDLAAMPRSQEARTPVQRRAEVVAPARLRFAGVERHADLEGPDLPGLRLQGALPAKGGGKGIRRATEGDAELVAHQLEDVALVRTDRLM
jgi:hypothetical protein